MADPSSDRIHIRDLALRCIIGVKEEESFQKAAPVHEEKGQGE